MTTMLAGFGVGRGDEVSAVGAGGKTTLVYRLAREARAAGLRVLVTSTTHMGALHEATTGPVVLEADEGWRARLDRALSAHGLATLLGRRIREDKIQGLPKERVAELRSRADLVLVEADGARGRSLKVPADDEPVVPAVTTLLLVLAALDVLGEPLSEERVHRLDLVCAATGSAKATPVDERILLSALRFAGGYAGRMPRGARLAAFLNKTESAAARAAAPRIAAALVPPYHFAAAGSARGGGIEIWRGPASPPG